MKISFPSREFDDAVAGVCHDSASDEQVRALNELLRSDAAGRDEYILRLELHSCLASEPDLFAQRTKCILSVTRLSGTAKRRIGCSQARIHLQRRWRPTSPQTPMRPGRIQSDVVVSAAALADTMGHARRAKSCFSECATTFIPSSAATRARSSPGTWSMKPSLTDRARMS